MEISNLIESFEKFREMEKYYNGKCVVKYWMQETMESGRWITIRAKTRDVIYCIKNGYYERATIEEVFTDC